MGRTKPKTSLDEILDLSTRPDVSFEAMLEDWDRGADQAWETLRGPIRDELHRQDEERRRLWGNRYPRFLGQKPPEEPKEQKRRKNGENKRSRKLNSRP